LVQAGKASEAITAFRREALAGRGSDTAWFNAGTAALLAGRLDDAKDALDRAAGSLDPGLRYRALYNLGVVAIHAARKDSSVRAEREAEGLTRFRQALLLDPSAADAKWNMELLLRPAPPTSGGRKQGKSPPQPQQGPRQEQQRQRSTTGLSPGEADAILSSVERSEAATRTGAVRRQRLRTTASTRDW
jgi:tetratricopeptide (TPR) repeat protein